MRRVILFFFMTWVLLHASAENCKPGWLSSSVKSGGILCVKAFVKFYPISFTDAKDICANHDAIIAPMKKIHHERVIREAKSMELPVYSLIYKPVFFYIGARKNESNSAFHWIYDNSVVRVISNRTVIQPDNTEYNSFARDCLMFTWNVKQPYKKIHLQQTFCDCIQPGHCSGQTRGVICAKVYATCPTGYLQYNNGTMCYMAIYDLNLIISADTASNECRKVTGGNLATIPNKGVNEFVKPGGGLFTAFGLRCPTVKFGGDRSSCKWDDGTSFEYQNWDSKIWPLMGANGCCDYFTGEWSDCYSCNATTFNGYICQAPLQLP